MNKFDYKVFGKDSLLKKKTMQACRTKTDAETTETLVSKIRVKSQK